jgi:formylglycine-generating enzyme required for sulfatase activity
MCTDGRLRCGTNNRVACVRRTIPAPAEVCDNGIDDDCNRVVDDSAACVQNYPATRGLTLGSNDPAFGEGDDAPEHQVCLAEFSIDRREVTFQALATWLSTLDPTRLSVGPTPTPLNPTQVYGRYLLYNDGGTVVPLVLLPAPPDDLTIDRRAYGFAPHNPRSATLPVVNVTWYGADRYCRYAGKHLPSEAEFFRAAQGPDGRRPFPWGAENPSCDRANVGIGGPDGGPCVGAPVAVGSLARGANPEGVFELYGNINEWMWDYLDDNLTHTENRYYRSLPPTLDAWCTAHPRGPLGPDGGSPIALPNTDGGLYCVQCRMAHGRHYRTVDLRIGIRRWLDADRTDGTVGFRCASGGADR